MRGASAPADLPAFALERAASAGSGIAGRGAGPQRPASSLSRRPARWLCVAVAVLWLMAGAGVARATPEAGAGSAGGPEVPFDAFAHSTQSFFQAVRFGFEHQDPHLARAGTLTAQLGATWSNTYIEDKQRILLDAETVYLRPRVAYVVSDAMEVSLQAPTLWMGGGHLDSLIDTYHRMTGLYRENRGDVPHNQLGLVFRQPGFPTGTNTVVLTDANSGTLRLAPVLSLRWRLTPRQDDTALTVTAAVDAPSLQQPNPIVARRGHDAAVGLAVGGPLDDRLTAMASAALTVPRSGRLVGFADPAPAVFSLMLGVGARWLPRQSFLAEMLTESPTARNSGTGFDRPATELLLGWKGQVHARLVMEAAFMENLFADNNDMDVGVHVALTARY